MEIEREERSSVVGPFLENAGSGFCSCRCLGGVGGALKILGSDCQSFVTQGVVLGLCDGGQDLGIGD